MYDHISTVRVAPVVVERDSDHSTNEKKNNAEEKMCDVNSKQKSLTNKYLPADEFISWFMGCCGSATREREFLCEYKQSFHQELALNLYSNQQSHKYLFCVPRSYDCTHWRRLFLCNNTTPGAHRDYYIYRATSENRTLLPVLCSRWRSHVAAATRYHRQGDYCVVCANSYEIHITWLTAPCSTSRLCIHNHYTCL